jgi:hypothetical protein
MLLVSKRCQRQPAYLYNCLVLNSSLTSITLWGCLVFLVAARSDAQIPDGTTTIHVESSRVLVPVLWTREITCSYESLGSRHYCDWDGDEKNVPNTPDLATSSPFSLGFVPVKKLRLYQDGKRQTIDSTQIVTAPDNGIRQDNLGAHRELTEIPNGFWSTPDTDPKLFSHWGIVTELLITYRPRESAPGSCHRLSIKGPHSSALQYRNEYCNVEHSSSDTLKGTPEARSLESYFNPGEAGTVHPSATINYFYTASRVARLNIDIAFPFAEVKPKKASDDTLFRIAIIAYGADGKEVSSQSDEVSQGPDYIGYSRHHGLDVAALEETMTRYDTQMELPPGEYRIGIAVSHGKEFGVTEVPLTINSNDEKSLSISSIALCKRVRKAGIKPAASDYVPLITRGYEFTPSADALFAKGDSLMAYFEVYEPSSSQPPPVAPHLNYRMKITNESTRAVALDTEENADSSMQPGNLTIPIAVEPVLKELNLSPGKYTFAIQATDSAGRTASRTTEFSIE